MEFNILEREEKLEEIRKDKAAQEKITSSELKLEMLTDTINKIVYILDKKLERHEANTDVDYLEQPMSFPDKKKLNHYKT